MKPLHLLQKKTSIKKYYPNPEPMVEINDSDAEIISEPDVLVQNQVEEEDNEAEEAVVKQQQQQQQQQQQEEDEEEEDEEEDEEEHECIINVPDDVDDNDLKKKKNQQLWTLIYVLISCYFKILNAMP